MARTAPDAASLPNQTATASLRHSLRTVISLISPLFRRIHSGWDSP